MPYSNSTLSQTSSSHKAVRNRIYAQRSRQRHRNYVSCLEQERQELLQRLDRLEAENRVMRQLIRTGNEASQTNEQIFNQVLNNSDSAVVTLPSEPAASMPLNSQQISLNAPVSTPHIFSPIPMGTAVPAPSPVFFSDFSRSTASSVMMASRSSALDSPLTFTGRNFNSLVNCAEWMEGNEVMNWMNGRSRFGTQANQRKKQGNRQFGRHWSLSF